MKTAIYKNGNNDDLYSKNKIAGYLLFLLQA